MSITFPYKPLTTKELIDSKEYVVRKKLKIKKTFNRESFFNVISNLEYNNIQDFFQLFEVEDALVSVYSYYGQDKKENTLTKENLENELEGELSNGNVTNSLFLELLHKISMHEFFYREDISFEEIKSYIKYLYTQILQLRINYLNHTLFFGFSFPVMNSKYLNNIRENILKARFKSPFVNKNKINKNIESAKDMLSKIESLDDIDIAYNKIDDNEIRKEFTLPQKSLFVIDDATILNRIVAYEGRICPFKYNSVYEGNHGFELRCYVAPLDDVDEDVFSNGITTCSGCYNPRIQFYVNDDKNEIVSNIDGNIFETKEEANAYIDSLKEKLEKIKLR